MFFKNRGALANSKEAVRIEEKKARQIFSDFPWLWAIRAQWHCSYAATVTVSQNMDDLRVMLLRPSNTTTFELWTHHSNWLYEWADEMGSYEGVKQVPRAEGLTWAEAVMVNNREWNVQHLVVLDQESHHLKPCYPNITIFRHPGNAGLETIIEAAARLCGSKIQWQSSRIATD